MGPIIPTTIAVLLVPNSGVISDKPIIGIFAPGGSSSVDNSGGVADGHVDGIYALATNLTGTVTVLGALGAANGDNNYGIEAIALESVETGEELWRAERERDG